MTPRYIHVAHAVALVAVLAGGAAEAATLHADGVCTLRDAILSANANFDQGACVASGFYGTDTIYLDADVELSVPDTAASTHRGGGYAGLPDVTSRITIMAGTASSIRRHLSLGCNPAQIKAFRLFNVVGVGADLTLKGIELRNGCIAPPAGSYPSQGGAILVDQGTLALDVVVLRDHTARGGDEGLGPWRVAPSTPTRR